MSETATAQLPDTYSRVALLPNPFIGTKVCSTVVVRLERTLERNYRPLLLRPNLPLSKVLHSAFETVCEERPLPKPYLHIIVRLYQSVVKSQP